MKDLVIFGAGGMAKEVAGILVKDINKEKPTFRHVAYVVDDEFFQKSAELHGVPIVPKAWLLAHRDDVVCVCAIGYPKERRKTQKNLTREGVRFVSLLHPTTRVKEGTIIGNGCIIQPNCAISLDCRLGDGVFFNGDVNLGHDVILEDFVTCFPRVQLSGNVHIGEAACIGSMSFINERRRIGSEAVVAPGSIVFNNVKSGVHVMGNPAKRVDI